MKALNFFIIGLEAIIKFSINFIKYFFIGLITIITIIPYYIIKGLQFLFSNKKYINNTDITKIEKKIIPITILTLSITTYLISVFILTRWFVQSQRTKNFTDDFTKSPIIVNKEEPIENSTEQNNENITNQYTENNTNQYEDSSTITPAPEIQAPNTTQTIIDTSFINVNLNYYNQKNDNTVAWIQVNGTKVKYPVVQYEDNNFYLNHDFYKRKTTNGWIFGDYRNNFETFDNNTIIYGHNLINDTMFGSIPNLLNKTWFNNKNNHYIKLSTKNTNSVWQIFSVYKTEPTTYYLQTKFTSTTSYQEFLNTIKNNSVHNLNLDLNYTDKIITLSTCDDIGTKRVVVHAKLINIESK